MESVYINSKKEILTQKPSDFALCDKVLEKNLEIALDVMNNCIDVIYDLVKASYPGVYRPELFLSNKSEVNAYADSNKKRIIINLGLIVSAIPIINRYNEEILNKYQILRGEKDISVQSGVRVSLWRFVILHELYHLWNGHSQWLCKYIVNKNGNIVIRKMKSNITNLIYPVFSEVNKTKSRQQINKEEIETNITFQALEMDADSSAVCMLINLMFFDMKNREIKECNQKDYIKVNLAYIMAGLSSAFCLFDKNVGCRFELLDEVEFRKHPIPAIRFFYAEEIADAAIQQYVEIETDLYYVESEWQKIVCDIESEFNGLVDMGQVFFYPAHTEIAQKHLCRVKKRLNDMNDTLMEFALGNTSPKLSDEDIAFEPNAVWFDKKGKSLKGWTNPATGKSTAIRSDKMPVAAKRKIGRNESCPCGSGIKFKRCCIGKGIYD